MTAFARRSAAVAPCAPTPVPARPYALGSPERWSIAVASNRTLTGGFDVPAVSGGREVRTGTLTPIVTAYQHCMPLGQVDRAEAHHVAAAIDAAGVFILAVTPFNFVSTCALVFGSALFGNTDVSKPAESDSPVARPCLQLLRDTGLPVGVVSRLYGTGPQLGPPALLTTSSS